uniref:Reverse transcriptase Ty1/copia-type domain-containing protein n=1 Tax=Cannabis sativa TaxID=3483 RepID=A0A803NRK0_CANSA
MLLVTVLALLNTIKYFEEFISRTYYFHFDKNWVNPKYGNFTPQAHLIEYDIPYDPHALLTTMILELSDDESWYVDTGATNHVANDTSHLDTAAPYMGNETMVVGNDAGLTRLAQAGLGMEYWWHAMASAVFTINRLPTLVLNNVSPYECLFSKKPDLTLVKPFGCSFFPHIRAYNTHKLELRSEQCLFLGYSTHHKGYICEHPSGKMFITRHVVFDESHFLGYPNATITQQFVPLVTTSTQPQQQQPIPIPNSQINTDTTGVTRTHTMRTRPTHVCQLHKVLYGLKHAPRAWNQKLKDTLVQKGFMASKSDNSIFTYGSGQTLIILLVYVDDFLITGPNIILINKLIEDLNHTFSVKDLDSVHYFLAESLTLQGYSDADWASCIDDRKSTGGYAMFFGGNLVSWSAKNHNVVARSSTKSEFRSLANAAAEIKWLMSLLLELQFSTPTCPILWVDNQSVVAIAVNPLFHARSKQIEIVSTLLENTFYPNNYLSDMYLLWIELQMF